MAAVKRNENIKASHNLDRKYLNTHHIVLYYYFTRN